jgi:hypothetical protein
MVFPDWPLVIGLLALVSGGLLVAGGRPVAAWAVAPAMTDRRRRVRYAAPPPALPGRPPPGAHRLLHPLDARGRR